MYTKQYKHTHKKQSKGYTVKPRPEAHMDTIPSEAPLKSIHLIPQDQTVHWVISNTCMVLEAGVGVNNEM